MKDSSSEKPLRRLRRMRAHQEPHVHTIPDVVAAEGGPIDTLRRLDECSYLTGEYFSNRLEKAYVVHRFDTEAKGRRSSLLVFGLVVGFLYLATMIAEAKLATGGEIWPGPSLGLYMVLAGLGCMATGIVSYILTVYPANKKEHSDDLVVAPDAEHTEATDSLTPPTSLNASQSVTHVNGNRSPTHDHGAPRSCLNKTLYEMCRWYEILVCVMLVIALPVQAFAAEGFMAICYNIAVREGNATERCTNHIYPWTLCVYVLGPVMLRPRLKHLYSIFIANVVARAFGRFIVTDSPLSRGEFGMALTIEFFALVLLSAMFWVLDKQSRALYKSRFVVYANTETAKSYQRDLDAVLQHLLPKHALDRLTRGQPVVDSSMKNTISLCDLYDFEQWSTKVLPLTAVRAISTMVNEFDKKIRTLGLHKVKARGDRYLCSTKLRGDQHSVEEDQELQRRLQDIRQMQGTESITAMGLEILSIINFAAVQLDTVSRMNKALEVPLKCRVGLHTGQTFGAIVGTNSVSYDVFGPSVAIVSSMVMQQRPDSLSASTALLELFHECTGYSITLQGTDEWPVESYTLFSGQTLLVEKRRGKKDPKQNQPTASQEPEETIRSNVIPQPAYVVDLTPEGIAGVSRSVPVFYIAGEMTLIPKQQQQQQRPQRVASGDTMTGEAEELGNSNGPTDHNAVDAVFGSGAASPNNALSVLSSPVGLIDGFAALVPTAREDTMDDGDNVSRDDAVISVAPDFDYVAAAQRRSVLIERVNRLKVMRAANSRKRPVAPPNFSGMSQNSDHTSNSNPLARHSSKKKPARSATVDQFSVASSSKGASALFDPDDEARRYPHGKVWSVMFLSASQSTSVSTSMSRPLNESGSNGSVERTGNDLSLNTTGSSGSTSNSSDRGGHVNHLEVMETCSELQKAVVENPDVLFATAPTCVSNAFVDKRIEALYLEHLVRHQMPRDALAVNIFFLLLATAMFFFVLVEMRSDYSDVTASLILHICLILFLVIRCFYLKQKYTALVHNLSSEKPYPRAEAFSLLLVVWGMYCVFILAPANITNNSIEYWFVFCGAAQGVAFQSFSYMVSIPLTFSSYCLYVLWWLMFLNVSEGANFFASNLITLGCCVYIIIFAQNRERQLRARFRNVALAEAQLQAANDEIELQKALLNMIFPSHVVKAVVENLLEVHAAAQDLSKASPETQRKAALAMNSHLYFTALKDIVAIHLRLDTFVSEISKLHHSASPSDAHSYIEQTLSHVDRVMKLVNDQEFAKAGAHRVLHKINLIGDCLLLAGPIFSTDQQQHGDYDSDDIATGSNPTSAGAKSMVHAAALIRNEDGNDEEEDIIEPASDEELLAGSCRGTITLLMMLLQQPVQTSTTGLTGTSSASSPGRSLTSRTAENSVTFPQLPSSAPGGSNSAEAILLPSKLAPTGPTSIAAANVNYSAHTSINSFCSQSSPRGGPTLRFSAVAVVGSAFATVIGADHASFDIMGVAVRQSAALINAAPTAFVGVDESFQRAVDNLLVTHATILKQVPNTSDVDDMASQTTRNSDLHAVLPTGPSVTWRVRGVGVAKMHPLVVPTTSETTKKEHSTENQNGSACSEASATTSRPAFLLSPADATVAPPALTPSS